MPSAANSILRDVEPGYKTGLYYITIANLPFGTSWHELKDWLRCACNVEHVEIFNSSTSGWVRVKGEDNFRRAWARLNQGEFGGRIIIADGRNATERIKVKELVDATDSPLQVSPLAAPRDPMSSVSFGHGAMPPASPLTTNYSSHPRWPVTMANPSPPMASYASYQTMQPPQLATGFPASQPAYYPQVAPAAVYPGQHFSYGYGNTPATNMPIGQTQYEYPVQQFAALSYDSGRPLEKSEENRSSSGSSGRLVVTEQRKIIVKHLGNHFKEEDVRKLIKGSVRAVTSDSHQLQHLDIPRGSDGGLRGHIFATFKSAEVAQGVAEDLDGTSFHKRVLDVRLTCEGVSHDSEHHQKRHREPKAKDNPRAKPQREKSKGKRRDKENVHPSANALQWRSTMTEESQANAPDETRNKPIIADGSCPKLKSPVQSKDLEEAKRSSP